MKCSYLALTTLLMLPLGARGQAQLEKSTKTPPSVLGEQRTEPNGGEYGPFLSEAVPTGPGLRVTLSRPVYRITIDPKTGAPRMPKDVKAFVTVQNWPEGEPVPTELTWRVLLDWKFTHYPTHHPIAHQTFTQPSPLKVDFGQEIRGGVLTVFASTKLHNQPVWGKTMGLVLGENPSRKVVLKAFPRSRFGLIASKIAVAESGMRQFTNASVSDPGGLPVVSRSNDIGMMQLNAPTGAITSPDQVWDWRANLLRGMEMLAGKRRTTVLASRHASEALRVPNEPYVYQVACVNFGRLLMGLPLLPNPTPEMLSEKVGSGVVWGEEDPDHLNLSQVERDAIRRYNGGREYAFKVEPDPDTLSLRSAGWEVDPTRGGIRATSGDANYVTHVLHARSGLDITPPKPPKSHKKRRSHRPLKKQTSPTHQKRHPVSKQTK